MDDLCSANDKTWAMIEGANGLTCSNDLEWQNDQKKYYWTQK